MDSLFPWLSLWWIVFSYSLLGYLLLKLVPISSCCCAPPRILVPCYFQSSVRLFFLSLVSFPLFFIILLKTDDFFNFSVCIFIFQPSIHIDDFLLYSFQCTYTFFQVEKPIQNTLDTSLLDWGSISLRRGVEGNNHFFDLLLASILVLYWRKCFHCAACWWWLWKLHIDYGWYWVLSFVFYKAGFVTFRKLNNFVKATCFKKIKPWDEHWEVSNHQLLMVFS